MARGIAMTAVLLACGIALARESADAPGPAGGVPGVAAAQLTPAFWIARMAEPDRPILDADAIAAQNARLEAIDPTFHSISAFPGIVEREQARAWIEQVARPSHRALYDDRGLLIPDAVLASIADDRNLEALPAQAPTRFGLVVRRASLRAFPTETRAFSAPGDTDIDRFQETALDPGTAVALVHRSRDGRWWFVVSPRYRAWMAGDAVAEGTREEVIAYARQSPFRVVTAATAHTVFTPDLVAVSQLRLDMGTRIPLHANWPADTPVNGQSPHAAHVVDLPVRGHDGTLRIAPALIQANAETAAHFLPLTRANVVRQAFKFLGERYGWGDSFNGRDCSSFVADVYASMGVRMPRNTGDQAASPALRKRSFAGTDDVAVRLAAARALEPGDLVYIPGHVMLVIGTMEGQPYVIHDTTAIRYRLDDGSTRKVPLNAVSVTPLLPLLLDDRATYVERMTTIVSMRPDFAMGAERNQ